MKKSKRLKRKLLIMHWHQLLKDNPSLDLAALDKRLKPIAYLRSKLDDRSDQRGTPDNQLNLFE